MTSQGSRYDDRFDAATYADDPLVGVFVTPDDADAVWVPEQVFERLVHAGRAYSLHLLPLLLAAEPVRLNAVQTQNLLSELDFIAGVLSIDPLVVDQVATLSHYLQQVIAADPSVVVTVDGV